MAGATCVVLGGGIGGVVAANELRKKLADEHRVVLVDKSASHIFNPALPWLMLGWRDESQITRDLSILAKRGIDYVNAPITDIDTTGRKVKAGDQEISYDYLVISLGADLAPTRIPGFAEGAHTFYNLEGAKKLAAALKEFRGGRVVLVISSLPYKCPAAPYEGTLLIDHYLRQRGLADKFSIEIYTPEKLPMPVAGPRVGQQVKELVESRGVKFNPEVKLAAIDPRAGETAFENDLKVKYDLLIAVPPHEAPAVVKESGLTNETGWIPAEPRTLATAFENVYAIGDVAAIKLVSGMMLPKAAVFAEREARVVVDNIVARVQGRPAAAEFPGTGGCFLEIGGGKAAYAQGEFFAEPNPNVQVQPPSFLRHWSKVIYEKYWLWRWF